MRRRTLWRRLRTTRLTTRHGSTAATWWCTSASALRHLSWWLRRLARIHPPWQTRQNAFHCGDAFKSRPNQCQTINTMVNSSPTRSSIIREAHLNAVSQRSATTSITSSSALTTPALSRRQTLPSSHQFRRFLFNMMPPLKRSTVVILPPLWRARTSTTRRRPRPSTVMRTRLFHCTTRGGSTTSTRSTKTSPIPIPILLLEGVVRTNSPSGKGDRGKTAHQDSKIESPSHAILFPSTWSQRTKSARLWGLISEWKCSSPVEWNSLTHLWIDLLRKIYRRPREKLRRKWPSNLFHRLFITWN